MVNEDPYPGNEPAYMDQPEEDVFGGAEPRVFVTEPPGRAFVWSKAGWFERIAGETGAVEFSHVADSESELRQWVGQSGDVELTEIDDAFARTIREEFLEESPLYPEAPELSNQ